MLRRVTLAAVLVAPFACGNDGPDCSGLACLTDSGTAGTMTTTTTSSTMTASSTADDGDPSTGAEASSNGDASTTMTTTASTTDPDGGESTSQADDSSSGGEDVTTGPPCRGPNCPTLGECFGLGVWQSCTQYCAAGKAECVEGGCEGATVFFYGDVDDCVAMQASGSADQACDAGFPQGGGASFGRCCCD